MGGAARNVNFPCHLCSCSSTRLAHYVEGNERCKWCKEMNNEQCYCHNIENDSVIASRGEECKELEEKYPFFKELDNDAGFHYLTFLSDPTVIGKESNPAHISFMPNNQSERRQFGQRLAEELLKRSISPMGGLEERRERLRSILRLQIKYKRWKAGINRYEDTRPNRLIPVGWCVPCVFHMHNRITEKMLCMLLKKGYSLRTTRAEKDEFVKSIEDTVNTVIIGSEHSKTNFPLHLSEDKSDVADISLSDGRAKLIMSNIDLVLADVFDDSLSTQDVNWETICSDWTNVFGLFCEVNEYHQSRLMFTDEMINEYGRKADCFFRLWIRLTGSAGITNYIHLIGCGHMRWFLQKYRNLYMFSQQGWEQMNKRANGIYHRHSQKGGEGAKESERSQILPIFRFFVRKWMWNTGLGTLFFDQGNIPS